MTDDAGDRVATLRRALTRGVDLVTRIGERLVAPLRTADDPNAFRLSSVETHTTTIDGDTGWGHRPPATVRCPECAAEILQADARDPIDCPACAAEFQSDRFTDLELLTLTCPVCRTPMQHGRRHPHTFDVPEWATCGNCQYHWELKHFY
ncbi:hypothetical protein [Haloplanus salilacus]|uniref:hypothetical protein n=1 Tax=Haloplanus salilacus TaxID=2949994 RepID=UPI0030CE674E